MKYLAIGLLTILTACGEGVDIPITNPTASICNAQNTGSGNAACRDIIIITNPTATPTPTPNTACIKTIPTYQSDVTSVLNTVIASSGNNQDAVVLGFVTAMRNLGFQTVSGKPLSPDEFAIKNTNTFSETYDVWKADGTPQVLYVETCLPAKF